MKVLAVIIGLTAALVVAAAAPATPRLPAQAGALKAIRLALAAGRIDGATANAGRTEIARAARLIRTLPGGRREPVAVALGELAAFSGRLTAPRALALIGQLQVNDDYFAKHYPPAPKTDVTDADGVVYRYFPGRCLEFHPLANFGALNARVAANDAAGAQRLADALIARGVYQQGGGIGWEYFFDYSGGRAPWLSGMAQAVAAQAFARTAALVPEEATTLMREARAAYSVIPGRLLTSVPAGPWIRLYSFQSVRVLNAQLQAVLSLQSYATAAEDPDAAALAARMQRAAAATLPSFDTGYWTYYSLPNEPSPLDYQQFVVQLLRKLAPSDPLFAAAATRIAAYQQQPPAFKLTNAALGALRFWLSKPATVQVNTAAGPTKLLALGDGWHTLAWPEPKRPGVYPVHVTAVDWAGNRATFDALPIVRATAAGTAAVARTTSASTKSAGTPFAAGAALDDPSQGTALQTLGLHLARLGVVWPAGATAPDPTVLAALQQLPAGLSSVLELNASPLPADDAGRGALAQYAAALAQQTPGLQSLVLAPAPTTA
ncbi:MAG TPA: D-glucuronyl C5-epimerase family protein, partial [Gaiellaceae bacterium]|nr:D-glucuronyl C5-epimerase family protein [Gaiellaceae bacterium]